MIYTKEDVNMNLWYRCFEVPFENLLRSCLADMWKGILLEGPAEANSVLLMHIFGKKNVQQKNFS